MRDKLISLATRVILVLVRRWARLSDRAQVRLFSALEWVFSRVKGMAEALPAVRELRELAEKDPEAMTMLRNLILEARDEQLFSLIRGILRHQAKQEAIEPGALAGSRAGRPGRPLLHVGLVGDHFDLRGLRGACSENPQCRAVTVQAAELLDGPGSRSWQTEHAGRGIEIADPMLASGEVLYRALSQHVAVSLHHSLASSSEVLRRCLALSRSAGTPFRLFYPALFYPPVQKMKRLLDEGLLGEVSSIRVRATIGGKGGALPPETPPPERYLGHPAFDHFLLLAFLGGEIEKVTAYLHPMHPQRGGQGLVDCKFAYPGRYGLLECTFAPDLYVRSEFYPYDLEIEVAGTDGVLWLTRGMAERTQAAPLRVRVGKRAYSIGVESGLETGWSGIYRNAVADLVARVGGKAGYGFTEEEMLSAVRLKNRAYEAAESRAVIAL